MEENKVPERKKNISEEEVHFDWGKEKKTEKKELTENDKIISEELKREIELMQVDDNLKKEAEQKANKIQFLADDEKLKNLLNAAKEKGVVFAINVAKKMNDPFLLDALHDILAKEGYYKKFVK